MFERSFFWIILALCTLSSALGIAYGVHYSSVNDAGKGGAVADSIALLALFSTRNYAANVYGTLNRSKERVRRILRLRQANQDKKPIDEISGLSEKFKTLELRLKIEGDNQYRANIFLAISTIIGTLTWGFGDDIAKYIIEFMHWLAEHKAQAG